MLKFTVLFLCASLMISASIAEDNAMDSITKESKESIAPSSIDVLPNKANVSSPTDNTTTNSSIDAPTSTSIAAPMSTISPTSVSTVSPSSTITNMPNAKNTYENPIISHPKTTPSTTTTTPSTTSTTPTTPQTTPMTPSTTWTRASPKSSGKWIVDELNKTCIIIQMAVQFNVTYTTNNTNKMKTYMELDMPLDNRTVATGVCGSTEQNITLTWKTQNDDNTMILHFVQNASTKHYFLDYLDVSLSSENFPNISSNETLKLVHKTSHHFNTELSNSYRCLRLQTLNLTTNTNNETVGVLKLTELQFQAFRNDNSTTFGVAEDCAFDTPDIVPIVVGCALAALVVIVLIAYLVGRRRRQTHGYLSM